LVASWEIAFTAALAFAALIGVVLVLVTFFLLGGGFSFSELLASGL
jgi:hypothetical protein